MGLMVTIELDHALEQQIRARTEDGGYPSIAACIEDIIRSQQSEPEALDPETTAKLRAAFDEPADDLPFFDPAKFHADLKARVG